jgi:streptogramin lyase
MRKRTALGIAAALSAAACLLSACSGAPQSSSIGLVPTGVARQSFGHTNPAAHPAVTGGRVLYVTDVFNQAVEIFAYVDREWKRIGALTAGMNTPEGDWVDRNGNLYVVNSEAPNVTEWVSGNPTFTYSSGLTSPRAVTTDRYGAVYVADFRGNVIEYRQGSNSPAVTCQVPSGAQARGIALDRHGNVFVTIINLSQFTTNIVEYRHGLIDSNCNGTTLPVSFSSASNLNGIVVDPQGNLLVTETGLTSAVDIIAPPYTSVTGTLGSGWAAPTNVTINRPGTEVYVTDVSSATVSVLSYPSGSTLATLGSANGLSLPWGAVATNNYVP